MATTALCATSPTAKATWAAAPAASRSAPSRPADGSPEPWGITMTSFTREEKSSGTRAILADLCIAAARYHSRSCQWPANLDRASTQGGLADSHGPTRRRRTFRHQRQAQTASARRGRGSADEPLKDSRSFR